MDLTLKCQMFQLACCYKSQICTYYAAHRLQEGRTDVYNGMFPVYMFF